MCVAAVLGDALHRVSVLGGRAGMSRSLGSVYGGAVTRFLGGSVRGVARPRVDAATPGVTTYSNAIAVSGDGATVLVSNWNPVGSHGVHEFSVPDGSRRRVIGGKGDGPLQFEEPHRVCIAPDGFVFVADCGNGRVQVLTPALDFHCFIGQDELEYPAGVCASADVVVVSEMDAHCIAVFNRCDGALVRRFGHEGTDDGGLVEPHGLCFMSGDRHVAVAEWGNNRVSVFSIDGEFIRHVGVDVVWLPQGVAASAFDELVVADRGNRCLRVFSSTGDLLASFCEGHFNSVAVHGGSVFVLDVNASTVSLIE
jgi:DNA-binding beta-propeller fold protein YncE